MAAHRFWRFAWDTSARGFGSCATMELRDTPGGPDLTQGIANGGFASSAYNGSYDGSKAFDGDAGTFWSSSGNNPNWLAFDFGGGNEKNIVEVSILPRQDSSGAYEAPQTGGLEWSDDNATWTRVWSIPSTIWANNSPIVFDEPSPPPPQTVSKMGVYVVEGPVTIPEQISKMGVYVVEGTSRNLLASKLAVYVVEGPPPPVPPASDHYGQMMVG